MNNKQNNKSQNKIIFPLVYATPATLNGTATPIEMSAIITLST